MNTTVKTIAAAGALFIVYRALSLNKLAQNISTSISNMRVHSIGLGGLKLAFKAKVNNPTRVSATVVNPSIRLFDQVGNIIGESIADGKRYPIRPTGVSEIGELMINIPLISILQYINVASVTGIVSLITGAGTGKTKTFLSALNKPIYMSAMMIVDGVMITTPKTAINR